ncbi:MAG TPA: DeoR/GlpR transcriptional regulator [Firmicutes bacterium]|nr:DeoR/GlpR transcriptional regulator [Bacillota bacterium]
MSTMFSIERQALILELLDEFGKVDVKELAAKFSTSNETIRRDLRELEGSGILKRTHGGAVIIPGNRSEGYEYPLLARGIQRFEEKQIICRTAATLLEDGDTIFLDNSSTTMSLIRFVPPDIKITVVTNSIKIMLEASKFNKQNIVVIGIGGVLNQKNYSLTGMFSLDFAKNFFPDKAFMSCRGVDEKSGMTDASILEIEVKRLMLTRSKQFILLADYSKFGLIGPVFMGDLSDVDCVITDSKADPDKLRIFDLNQTRILQAT